MGKERFAVVGLVALAAFGVAWSAAGFWQSRAAAGHVSRSAQDYAAALEAERPDKCETPPGYTDAAWREHMSHHPDRYAECLSGSASPPPAFGSVTVAELAAALPEKDFTLIDVHVPEGAHIEQTDAFIPYDALAANLERLPEDPNETIVVYCRSGTMGSQAAQELANLGYRRVFNLVGGTEAWEAAGNELVEDAL